MNEYFTSKNVLIGILLTLFGISIVDVIMRATVFSDIAGSISNFGEPFVTVCLSLLLIFFALRGKDRVFYILCGGWLAYFVLNQLFELPTLITLTVSLLEYNNWVLKIGDIGTIFTIASMICIVIIGGLLAEYLNDGSIFNRAFNGLCIAAVLMLVVACITHIHGMTVGLPAENLLVLFYNLNRITMLFLSIYFAYDSAKTQLGKTQL